MVDSLSHRIIANQPTKAMREEHHRWYSESLSRDIDMLVFGDRGIPLITFPTSMGSHMENRDFKLVESVKWFIDEGLIKVYNIDSVDALSWYNKKVHPSVRAHNHTCYDNMLHNELVPRAIAETGVQKVATAGCSFGGYHAANYAFRHPERVSHMISMGGSFHIQDQMDGVYDDNFYFNHPPDFLPGNNAPELWDMKIFLGTTEGDGCKRSNIEMSNILNAKGIKHWLDIRPWGDHDWPIWREMFPHYVSLF